MIIKEKEYMDRDKYMTKISKKDFNCDYFINLINHDRNARNTVIYKMLFNFDTIVYYHCYYVVASASNKRPTLYYVIAEIKLIKRKYLNN